MEKLGKLFSRNKNWIEKLKLTELELEKMKAENESDLLVKEIGKLEEEKIKTFEKGKGKSQVEKMMLAQKVKEIDMKGKIKYTEFKQVQKKILAVFNLIVFAQWKDKLQQKGIWNKLQQVTPDELLTLLTKLNLKNKSFEQALDEINDILSGKRVEKEEVDEETKGILELWEKAEKGEMKPEEIEKEISIEKKLKETEEE